MTCKIHTYFVMFLLMFLNILPFMYKFSLKHFAVSALFFIFAIKINKLWIMRILSAFQCI